MRSQNHQIVLKDRFDESAINLIQINIKMNFIDINRTIIEEFPHTYDWLKDFEKVIMNDNCEIIIRDTDHRYDSIRVEVLSRSGDHDTSWKYNTQIWNYINTHCCKCGSAKGVKTIGEYTLCSTVCSDCAEILKIKGVPIVGPETQLIPGLKHQSKIPIVKCRLKAVDGHLFYKYSNELYYHDEQYKVRNGSSEETVILSGVYTGLRDWKGERIYTGDIVLAEDSDKRKFWGLIMFGNPWGKSDRNISPQWNGFCLAHGWNSFPSALCWASRIEVVGNVVQNNEYVGPIPSDNDYESYCASHNEIYEFSDKK